MIRKRNNITIWRFRALLEVLHFGDSAPYWKINLSEPGNTE
jgi:hypothetical protein